MSVNADYQLQLNSLALQLIDSDTDKIITVAEMQKFVGAKSEEIATLNISPKNAADELSSILSENLESAQTLQVDDDLLEPSDSDTPQIAQLKASIKELNGKITGYDAKLKGLNKALNLLNAVLKDEQARYDDMLKDATQDNDKLNKVIQKIDESSESIDKDVKRRQKIAVTDAIANYDPNKDKDWDTYFKNCMSEVEVSPSLQSALSSLLDQSSALQLKSIGNMAAIAQQGDKIKALNAKAAQINTDIGSVTTLKNEAEEEVSGLKGQLNTQLNAAQAGATGNIAGKNVIQGGEAGLSAKDLLSLISDEEKELAKQYVTDISKCVIAKAMDGQWHIYESGDNWAQQGVDGYYMSIARKYGCGEGWSKGQNIVPWASGELSLSTSSRFGVYSGENNNTAIQGAIYTLNEVNDCWTDGCVTSTCSTYDTDSPLAFDINGDGVKTSDKVISYDIDGDGVNDNIFDSADAVLVFDKDHNGIAGENGSETFGNNTDLDGDGVADGYANGFEALKALAAKEGLINGTDDNVLDENDLAYLQDKWGLGLKQDGYLGETSSFKDAGVTQINLAATNDTTMTDNFDGKGNQLMTQNGATFNVNGQERNYADIWHKKLTDSEAIEANAQYSSSLEMNFFALNSEVNNTIRLADSAKHDAKTTVEEANEEPNIFIPEPVKAQDSEEETAVEETSEEETIEEETADSSIDEEVEITDISIDEDIPVIETSLDEEIELEEEILKD
ncbi:MAG: hypothetical protein IJ877_02115 [Candidatus Gastranaerophilales bacterium]|nr:hypothetical protein [Candidatus Gastranaerophilales bacterium]